MLLLYCVYVEWRWIRTRTQRRSTANEMNVEWWYIIMYVSIDDICRGRLAKIFEIYYGLENEWMNGCVCRYVGCRWWCSSGISLMRWTTKKRTNEWTIQALHLICFSPMTFWFLLVINLCLKYSWNVQQGKGREAVQIAMWWQIFYVFAS